MFKLTAAELDQAKRALDHHGYSTMLPSPAEWADLTTHWPDVRAVLCDIDLEQYRPFQPLVVTAAKTSNSTRPVHILHPQDMLFYTSLTMLLKDDIEASRVSVTEHRIYSYRASREINTLYSTTTKLHDAYMERLKQKAAEYKFVAVTDIADFYPRISQRGLRTILINLAKTKRARIAARLLISTFAFELMGRADKGIPTGPYASRLVAEALLNDIDEYLLEKNVDFVRWVDDFNLFFHSFADAQQAVLELSGLLDQRHGLHVQRSKTHVLNVDEFSSRMLVDLSELLSDQDEVVSLFGDVVHDYEIDDGLEDDFVEEVMDDLHAMELFEMVVDQISKKNGRPDFRVIDFAVRKLRHVKMDSRTRSDLLGILVENLNHVVPIIDKVSRLISLLTPGDRRTYARIGHRLLKSIHEVSEFDHYAVWILEIFGKDDRWGCVDDLVCLFRVTESDVVRRYSALAVAKAGHGERLMADWGASDAPLVRLAMLKAPGSLQGRSPAGTETGGALENVLWRKELVRKILAELGERRTRMTYGAVACLLDVQPPQGVGKWLGERRPEASWVVRKKDGRPSGYKTWQCHPDLYSEPHVIKSCCELRDILGVPPTREHRHGCDGGC